MNTISFSRRTFLAMTAATGLTWQAVRARQSEESGDEPATIGSRVEMFVDRWLIESLRGAELKLQHPIKREIALTLDQPWEGPSSAYYTVVKDGDNLRLYYRGSGTFQGRHTSPIQFCMAESRDGITFTRPELGLHEYDGNKQNNIVVRDPRLQDNFTPFLDSNPAAPADARYKAIASSGSGMLYALASPDGLNWRFLSDEPISTDGSFDSLNLAYWDPRLGKYRMFSRYLDVPGLDTNEARNRAVWKEGTTANWVRAIQSSTSDDFLHWEPAVPHQYAATAPREHFYTNATAPCPGAEHMLLSFPKRFLEERRVLAKEEHEFPGVSDAVFMSSRDGVHWDREFLEAWVRPGRDPRNWTQRGNMVAWGIVETAPDEFSLYISEHYEWPTNRLRRLTVRRHGFGSVAAGGTPGEMLTRPLVFEGQRLMLNYATSAAGSIRVELQSQDGRPLDGFALDDCREIYGDAIEQPVHWSGGADMGQLAGRPVRLRVVLRDADLFSVQFRRV